MTSWIPRGLGRIWVRVVLVAIALTGFAAAAQAQLTFYDTRAELNAAAPGTTLVNFEPGVITDPANGASFEGPLWSTTANGVFAAGDIPDGIIFFNSCSTSPYLILAGPGFNLWGWDGTGGFPSQVLIPSNDACSLSIRFGPAVDAVGLEIYSESASGYRVSMYGEGGAFIQHRDGVAGALSPGFFGVVSDIRITRIEVKAPDGTATGAFEAVDRVAFRPMPIFVDGFESGGTSAWSATVGDLEVRPDLLHPRETLKPKMSDSGRQSQRNTRG